MRLGWLLWLGACGRIGFDTATGVPPEAGASQPLSDGGSLEPPLELVDPAILDVPFGTPQLVAELSLPGIEEDDPCLTRDQLEIFFDRDDGGHDIYTSRRASIADPWPPPAPVVELNSSSTDEHPALSADGLRLYFTSRRSGTTSVWIASRANRDSPWGDIRPFDTIAPGNDVAMGSTSADDRVLVFSQSAGTSHDLYESRRGAPVDPWAPAALLADINTSGDDRGAHLDDYGTVMYYEQTAQLVWTRRDVDGVTWLLPTVVSELDMGDDQSDPWLSPDLRTIYFVRSNGAGTQDIYMATR